MVCLSKWGSKTLVSMLSFVLIIVLLAGCTVPVPSDAAKTMADQNDQKSMQAARVMSQVPVPQFNSSLERKNISDRLITTNNPNTLQWIYLFSAGRTIGRFPVRGKVTSGSKRLTSTQMDVRVDGGTATIDQLQEAPDEMGTYGTSGAYIFWFDPAGNYQQWQGDYFMSPVPYQIDKQYGTISVEIDATEAAKKSQYQQQIKDKPDVTAGVAKQ